MKVEQPDLWCAGFEINSLSVCYWMSGLVDVHYVEVRAVGEDLVVFFYVTNKDKTGILFQDGSLTGQKIDSFFKDLQPTSIALNNCVTNYST